MENANAMDVSLKYHFRPEIQLAHNQIHHLIPKVVVFVNPVIEKKMVSASIFVILIMNIGMVINVKNVQIIHTLGLNYFNVDYANLIVKSVRMLFNVMIVTWVLLLMKQVSVIRSVEMDITIMMNVMMVTNKMGTDAHLHAR